MDENQVDSEKEETKSDEIDLENFTLTLKDPIVIKGQDTVKTLKFVAPKTKHMRHFHQPPVPNDMFILIGKIAGLSSLEVDQISPRDMRKIVEIIEPFL